MSKTRLIIITAGSIVFIRQLFSLGAALGLFSDSLTERGSVVHAAPKRSAPQKLSNKASSVTFGDTVTGHATWSQSVLPVDKARELFLHVEFKAKNSPVTKPLPVSTLILIDRSGSMDGEKMDNTKRATLRAFKALRSNDSISIVSYSNHAQVHLQPTLRAKMSLSKIRKILDSIYPAGGTNISEGLNLAVELLESQTEQNSYNRILLISDGHANRGVTNPAQLKRLAAQCKRKGISLSSMGVGLDYNEDLLTAISEHSAGNYYYVRTAKDINSALAREIAFTKDVVARNVNFEFTLPDGLELERVFGYTHANRDGKASVNLGDFSANETRKLVAQIRHTPVSTHEHQTSSLLTLRYELFGNKRQKSFTKNIQLQLSSDPNVVRTSINPSILEEVARVTLAQTRREAALELQAGRYDQAKKQIKKALRDGRKNAARLNSAKIRDLVKRTEKQRDALQHIQPKTDAAKDFIKTEKFESRALQRF